jgi:hypothetical protein
MSEAWIQYVLARYSVSPVCAWQQLMLIPNCSTAPVWWEADLLAVSRAGYCTEVEIKCTLSDWKADQKKGKHGNEDLIKRFYYAGPLELMKRFEEVWTRPGSGIIGIDHHEGDHRWPRVQILRQPLMQKARKLTTDELIKMGRTAMIRYWTWACFRSDPEFKSPAELETQDWSAVELAGGGK